jgi:hypothetical protein
VLSQDYRESVGQPTRKQIHEVLETLSVVGPNSADQEPEAGSKIEVIPDESETTSMNGAPEFTSSKDGRLETSKLLKDVEKSYDRGVKLLEESKPAAKEMFWGMVERLADEAGRELVVSSRSSCFISPEGG